MTAPDPTPADEKAYLSFGGWAQAMPNPPALHERRRYVIDTECTAEGTRASAKGDREVRSLSILRVKEIVGAEVPPADTDENQGALFDEDGEVDAEVVDDEDGDNVTSIASARGE